MVHDGPPIEASAKEAKGKHSELPQADVKIELQANSNGNALGYRSCSYPLPSWENHSVAENSDSNAAMSPSWSSSSGSNETSDLLGRMSEMVSARTYRIPSGKKKRLAPSSAPRHRLVSRGEPRQRRVASETCAANDDIGKKEPPWPHPPT